MMSYLCMDRCILSFTLEPLSDDSSSNVTVQQFGSVETLPYNSSSNVTVQKSYLVESLSEKSTSNVTVQQSVLVETLPDDSSSSFTVQQSWSVDCILCNVQLSITAYNELRTHKDYNECYENEVYFLLVHV